MPGTPKPSRTMAAIYESGNLYHRFLLVAKQHLHQPICLGSLSSKWLDRPTFRWGLGRYAALRLRFDLFDGVDFC